MTRDELGNGQSTRPAAIASGRSIQLHLPPSFPLWRSKPRPLPSGTLKAEWRTTNLGLRLGADAAAATSASLLVSPVVCMIDRSIVEKASTGNPLRQSLTNSLTYLLTRPHTFLLSRPFFLIYTLYFSTYFTANTIDTLSSTVNAKPPDTTTSGPAKFLATSIVNMSLCVYKDSQYARLFGSGAGPAATIPKISYTLFAFRDSLTVFASFNLPPMIAPHLPSFSKSLDNAASKTSIAQFLAPAAMQLVSTPVHLLGLDLYNRAGWLGWRQRVARIGRDWMVSSFARMGRIVPAFGVGGVVNGRVRSKLMKRVE